MMDNSLLFNSCSSRFNDLIELALCYATSDKSILLRGDTGTGKELIAELIYKCSCRSDKSYKIVNIAAFNDNLFESEVFGQNTVGDVFERCVRNGAEEDFKLGVKKIIRVNCAKEAGNDQINHLLSNIAYEHLSGYKEGDPPLREVVDDILVKAIGCGLDMALIGGRFKPASMREVGKAMGIHSLVNGNRALLPLDRDGKDYILTTLRSFSPSDDCYPKAFNEVLQRC